jgi:hypothetical protein
MDINTEIQNQTIDFYNNINDLVFNPFLIAILLVVIIIFVGLSYYLGNSTIGNYGSYSDTSTSYSKFLGIIFICLLLILIIINGVQYFLGINVVTTLSDTLNPKVDIKIYENETNNSNEETTVPEIKLYKQVFNIPDNNFIYSDAKALCNAYGARLATYDEIETAYNKGGEWCNYGWSEGQMALFPTQKTTYDNLQTIPGHEHDCGRPGINGGYISNPLVKFGVNCYGNKPKMTDTEKYIMDNVPEYPLTFKDLAFQKRVDYWKDHLNEVIVSPFNSETWTRI